MDLSCCFESNSVLKLRDGFFTLEEYTIRMKKTRLLFTTLGIGVASLHAQEQVQTANRLALQEQDRFAQHPQTQIQTPSAQQTSAILILGNRIHRSPLG
jgi:LAS superfamily LD-carboxypeptidase LdcB